MSRNIVYWDQKLLCESVHTEFIDSMDNDLQDSHDMILQVHCMADRLFTMNSNKLSQDMWYK